MKLGAGGHLKNMFSWFFMNADEYCCCNDRAELMDLWGPDKCETNMHRILKWLEQEATTRKLPFVEYVARKFVRIAIKKARKDLRYEVHSHRE